MKTKAGIVLPWGTNSVGGATNVSSEVQIRGYGFAIVPTIVPFQGITRSNLPFVGDYPLVVEIRGKEWSERIQVRGPDAFFVGREFETIQLRADDPIYSFLLRQQFPIAGPVPAFYDIYAFATREEYMEFSRQTSENPGAFIANNALLGTNLNRQHWGIADGAAGANDPVTQGDNNVGSMGVDIRGHKWAKILLTVGNSTAVQPAGTGKVNLWFFDYSTGFWAFPDAAHQYAVQAQTIVGEQEIADVQLTMDVGRIYASASNVANGAATQPLSLGLLTLLR
jgi:hypothetical protein